MRYRDKYVAKVANVSSSLFWGKKKVNLDYVSTKHLDILSIWKIRKMVLRLSSSLPFYGN